MSITVLAVTPGFVAEVGDVDLAKPLTEEDAEAVKAAFWQYAVLVFPDQHLSHDQHLDFAALFGPLETTIGLNRTDRKLRLPGELANVSNLDDEGELLEGDSRRRIFSLGNRLWHTDSSFKYRPALCSLLYARSIPPVGGHTQFADQRAGYDALSAEIQRKLEGLVAEHSIFNSRARMDFTDFDEEDRAELPPVPQVMVRTIPETGRKSLYVASHAGRVLDMPEEEGRALIDELIAHVTQPRFVHTHRWRRHDLVMWDDRCTMHRATPFDELRWPRDMQRATVSDVANSCEQAGIQVAPLAG